MNLIWNAQNTPAELHAILRTLGEEYPLEEGSQGVCLSFEKTAERGGSATAFSSSYARL